MAVDPSIVGATSAPVTFEVERGAIRKLAEAIGDPNPVYQAGDLAPPTFPTTFRVPILGFQVDPAWLLHGGEEYVYERPIRAGDRIRCVRRIVDCYVKQGRLGQMTFVISELEGQDAESKLVFRGRSTTIVREKVDSTVRVEAGGSRPGVLSPESLRRQDGVPTRSWEPGTELPPLVKEPITKEQLVKYAGASGDYNLLHTDDETARRVGLDGVIAHGMLSMGFLGQLLTDQFGPGSVRRLQVRFAAMVRPGDVLTCRGVVKQVAPAEADRGLISLDVWAENQRRERVTFGEAEVYA